MAGENKTGPKKITEPHQLSGIVGEHEIIEVTASNEVWSTYTLADGTTARVKPVVAEFIRMKDQYTPDGEPIYHMRGGLIPSLRVARNLLKKP